MFRRSTQVNIAESKQDDLIDKDQFNQGKDLLKKVLLLNHEQRLDFFRLLFEIETLKGTRTPDSLLFIMHVSDFMDVSTTAIERANHLVMLWELTLKPQAI